MVIVLVPASFVIGGLLGQNLVARLSVPRGASAQRIPRQLLTVLWVFVGIGYLELVHQWVAAGTIPLLSGQIDAARISQAGGPTIILVDFLTVAVIVALAAPQRLRSREALVPLMIAGVGLCGFALQGGRGPLALPIVVAFLARAFLWQRPSTRSVLALALALVLLSTGVFYARTDQHRSQPFERELYGRVLPSTPRLLQPLVPLHIGIATNFTSLNGVVDHFPDGRPYGYGAYSAEGLDLFIPGARDLEGITEELTPPWITSTVAGPLWADGGPLIVVIGMALIGALVQGAFALAVRMRTLATTLAMAYLTYMALFGIYANLWTQQPDWLLVIPLLLLAGGLAEGSIPVPRWAATALRTHGRPA